MLYTYRFKSSISCILIFCHLLLIAVTAQLPTEQGYTGGKVVFIDTENTLYPLE